MQKVQHFKGKIFLCEDAKATRKSLMAYKTEPLSVGFEQTFLSSFQNLNFTPEEKKHLSKRHRELLNSYRQINPFALNADALKLVEQISHCKASKLKIEANDYGAYICLAALYSGKLPQDKTIEFYFEKSPIALFPKTLLKNQVCSSHKIIFRLSEDCWLKPFSSLYQHDKIKFYLKAA